MDVLTAGVKTAMNTSGNLVAAILTLVLGALALTGTATQGRVGRSRASLRRAEGPLPLHRESLLLLTRAHRLGATQELRVRKVTLSRFTKEAKLRYRLNTPLLYSSQFHLPCAVFPQQGTEVQGGSSSILGCTSFLPSYTNVVEKEFSEVRQESFKKASMEGCSAPRNAVALGRPLRCKV